LRPHPVACPRNDLRRKTMECQIEIVQCLLTFLGFYCHHHILCLLCQLFLAADSVLRKSSHRHVTFFVKRDKLELAFWFLCSVHADIQVPLKEVLGSPNCSCHSSAACAIHVTGVCFRRQTVSALALGLPRYSAQPTPC